MMALPPAGKESGHVGIADFIEFGFEKARAPDRIGKDTGGACLALDRERHFFMSLSVAASHGYLPAAFSFKLTRPTSAGLVLSTGSGLSYQTKKQGRQIGIECHGE